MSSTIMMSRPVDLAIQVLQQAHVAGADLRVAVAGELQKVHLAVDGDLPDQVGKEDERAVQDADEDGDFCPRSPC